MANLSSLLKQEMGRIARREINSQTAVTRRAAAQHRRDIAELKPIARDLQKRVSSWRPRNASASSRDRRRPRKRARFSPAWLKSHREKLAISAADYARLVGVSGLSIYNWEHGRTPPREKQLAALMAIRGLGKREALKRLELLEG